MRNIFTKALSFIKENPNVVYSLILAFLLPIAFFINTYLINSNYEKDIDKITQRKAVLVEDIINQIIRERIASPEEIQKIIDNLTGNDSEITSLTVSQFQNQNSSFKIVASNKKELIGEEQHGSIQNSIAWIKPEGVAFLDKDETGRFWNVTKVLENNAKEKVGLIAISFSLKNSDALISRTIRNSYWILFIIISIILLFVSNQTRLFRYALTVTRLKEIDKMKDIFISMASHELRSPLTAIRGYIDLLEEKENLKNDQETEHYMKNISLSIDRLNVLVTDMLEVSRIEGNRIPMEITNLDPEKIITESIEEIIPQADKKGLILSFNPSPICPPIKADAGRLKQVLINLISNSIKYTEEGSIIVSTERKNQELLITIADTGIGIPAEEQLNLFKKFHRVKNEKTKNIIGTGLGLWITSEIIRRMDGRITVESIEGVGSHFMIHLPVA